MCLLDGFLGPSVRGQETQAAQCLGAQRVHAIVCPMLCRALAGMGGMAATGTRSGAALGGDIHQRSDRERRPEPGRLAGREADRTTAAAIGSVASLGKTGRACRLPAEIRGQRWIFLSALNSK